MCLKEKFKNCKIISKINKQNKYHNNMKKIIIYKFHKYISYKYIEYETD
jgi:hypothetical protein